MRRALAALLILTCYAAATLALTIAAAQPSGRVDMPERLPIPDDTPLMTEQEKEWARESGVGSYRLGDMYYVDESLPSSYWEE